MYIIYHILYSFILHKGRQHPSKYEWLPFVIPEYTDYTWSSSGRTPSSTEQSARPYAKESGNGNATETSKKLSQTEVNKCEWNEQRKSRNLQSDLGAVSGRVRNSIPAQMSKKKQIFSKIRVAQW